MDSNIKEKLKDGIYIPSLEACWLYKANKEVGNYEIEDKYLEKLLNGKIDYSFELVENNILTDNIEIKNLDGFAYTLDIINVKFNKKYKYIKDGEVLEKMSCKQLRDWIYNNGSVFNGNKLSNWKRGSGKARIGDDLLILDSINSDCLDWARMGIKYTGIADIGSVRAYESLPLSSIIDIIEIDPSKNILVVDDYKSKFPWTMSKTWFEDGKLKTETCEVEECDSIWDGEGLLSNKIFEKYDSLQDKGVCLLRNRLTKCAAFNCNIEQFFRDYCEANGLDYDTFEVEDMCGNTKMAKDILLITTPSSLKIYKSNDDIIKTNEHYKQYGKNAWLYYFMDNAGRRFGVCKTEKASHHCITDEEGNVITYRNVLSYQILNTIAFTPDQLKMLVEPEIAYVERLKNDLDFFLKEVNALNIEAEESNEDDEDDKNEDIEIGLNIDVTGAFAAMCRKDPKFANTQVFKDYRRNFIDAYVNNLRKGKIRVEGTDYAVACGNPIELLYTTVGEFKGESFTLRGNQIHCTRFMDGESVVGFRNPHVVEGNIGKHICKIDKLIEKYMNATDNVFYLNSINYPTLSIYQGEDFDIDCNLLSNNKLLKQACNNIDEDIAVIPVNRIENTGKNDAELTPENMSNIDHIIAKNYIGDVINLSQEINSLINHLKYNQLASTNELKELYRLSSRLSSISCCEIDKAKKQFEYLDIPAELRDIKKDFDKVDLMDIVKISSQIGRLKQDFNYKISEVNKYKAIERKPHLKRIRELKDTLRINNLEKLTDQEETNYLDKIIDLESAIINISDKNERKPYLKKIREIQKIFNENEVEKLTDENANKLKEELSVLEELIKYINIEKQDEIDAIKTKISAKQIELSDCDSRCIKPLFFKNIGDNEAKKQRKLTNKKHRKELDKPIILQYCKDNNLDIRNLDYKNLPKDLKQLLKVNDAIQKEWEDKIYVAFDTPMDWLQAEIDTISNKKKLGTVQVIKLVKKVKHSANKDVVDYIVNNIKALDRKIDAYKLDDELHNAEKLLKIRQAKQIVVKNIIYMKLNKTNLYWVLKECLNSCKKNGKVDKKTGIESISLEVLFQAYGTGLLEMFC